MNIPDYNDTLCIYCNNYNKCNHNKFKVKIKNKGFKDELKYSYCKKYTYIGGNNEQNN